MLTRPAQVLSTSLPVKASLVASDGSPESVTLKPEDEEGSSVYGRTRYYSFSVPVHQDPSYTALEISRDGAAPTSFPLQNSIFVVPSMTTVQGSEVGFTVAARVTGQPAPRVDVIISAPVRQQGTLAPKMTSHNADARPGAAVPGYQLWEGSVDLGDALVTGAVSVSAELELEGGGVVRDVLYLGAGVAGW